MKSLYFNLPNDNSLKSSEQTNITHNSLEKPEDLLHYKLTLIDAVPSLLKFYDEIFDNPELYYVPIEGVGFGSSITGSTQLFLGDLLTLWQDEPWHTTCPKCNSQSLFIFGAGGSPLSGSGSAWGVCRECREDIHGITPFGKFFGAVLHKVSGPKQEKISSITLEKILAGVKS